MARWPLLLVALLLAGCSSPSDDPSIDAPADDAAPPAPGGTASEAGGAPGVRQDVMVFEGSMTGVGIVSPAEVSFTGISSRSQAFQVDEAATKLTASLVWDAPADLYLDLDGPASKVALVNSLTGPVDRSITFETTEVPAGSWSVHAWAQGPAVVTYSITVTVDYVT